MERGINVLSPKIKSLNLDQLGLYDCVQLGSKLLTVHKKVVTFAR